jgi:hypothetical protein
MLCLEREAEMPGWVPRLVRMMLCWCAAVIVVGVGFLVPAYLVFRLTFAGVLHAFGTHHGDLSDIVPAILGVTLAGVAGLLAGVVGSLLAAFPALALVGNSGVLDRLRRRRSEAPTHHDSTPAGWPFDTSAP